MMPIKIRNIKYNIRFDPSLLSRLTTLGTWMWTESLIRLLTEKLTP